MFRTIEVRTTARRRRATVDWRVLESEYSNIEVREYPLCTDTSGNNRSQPLKLLDEELKDLGVLALGPEMRTRPSVPHSLNRDSITKQV